MPERIRGLLLGALILALSIIAWTYQSTFLSIAKKWSTDAAFSHGYLIVPISLWLIWRRRADLRAVELSPAWLGLLMLVAATVVWVIATGTGVLVVEQAAAVAMIPAAVFAILGWPVTRMLALPLAFLFFAIPMGRALVPWLMEITADVSTWALQLSGVPILRNHMYISIPSGDFEVARACSGLNYVITGFVLGVLYSFLTYRKWWKRLISMAAFIVIPILANGLRVYITIGVSHLTAMDFGPGKEHVTFGRIFFILILFAMFWIGRRWRDDDQPEASVTASQLAPAAMPLGIGGWLVVLLAMVIPLTGPPYLASSVARAAATAVGSDDLAALPMAAPGWKGPVDGMEAWRPLYSDALEEQAGVYIDPTSAPVEVFVAVYGLGVTGGGEMISYRNRISSAEDKSLARAMTRTLEFDDGETLAVRQQIVRHLGEDHLIWTWFQVGDRSAISPYRTKAYEALAFVARNASDERILTLATPAEGGAAERLETFVHQHSGCVRSGFRPEACLP